MLLDDVSPEACPAAVAREARGAVGPVALPADTLAEGQRDAVLIALRDQEAAGIDVVTDGEQSRQHFVHGFLERIEGIDFSRWVTIGIRADRYKAEVPTVTRRWRAAVRSISTRCAGRGPTPSAG